MQKHTIVPSFMARSTGKAQTVELNWDGSCYSATLTDTNGVLGNYRFSASKSLYRGLGSIDIAAIARSVLMISRDESRPDIRYMYPIKSSLAPEGPAIAFSFKEHGGIVWHGKYDLNTAELMDSITVKTTKRERARAKLVQLLEHEDRPAKEVYAGLADIGVGSRTVEKAKKELQVTTYRSGGSWYWSLPKPK